MVSVEREVSPSFIHNELLQIVLQLDHTHTHSHRQKYRRVGLSKCKSTLYAEEYLGQIEKPLYEPLYSVYMGFAARETI